MPVSSELGTRMKEYYEAIPKVRLMRRTPVAIRIDGKAFHTFTRGFRKPFDPVLMKAMQETMKYLCENIQGCVFGYTQSDEITLILVDYQKLDSSAWFDYEVQKICSIAASMATMKFNKVFDTFNKELNAYYSTEIFEEDDEWNDDYKNPELIKEWYAHQEAIEKGAMFDARCFNIPKEEVCNLIYWRQLDAARNSVQMVGQAYFSHKELQNKTCDDIQEMLFQKYGINWNDFPVECKRGSACIKIKNSKKREHWFIDKNMPILKDDDRLYVEKWIYYEQI